MLQLLTQEGFLLLAWLTKLFAYTGNRVMGNSGIMIIQSIFFPNMEWEHSGYKINLSCLIREGPLGSGIFLENKESNLTRFGSPLKTTLGKWSKKISRLKQRRVTQTKERLSSFISGIFLLFNDRIRFSKPMP